MIEVKRFQCNPFQENCFVVSDATGEAVVIDPGAFFPEERQAVTAYIRERGFTLRHILCTHGHLDHIFGVDTLHNDFGLSARLHPADVPLYEHLNQQALAMLGITLKLTVPPAGAPLTPDEPVVFGQTQMHVIHTPGHSPGSVVLYIKDEATAFSGDTLFRMSVGRTDLEGGSWEQLMDSLQTLAQLLPPETKVLCGHGPATTIGDELHYNPYMRV